MFKILRWNVVIKYDPGRFFVPVTTDRYLSGISRVDDPPAVLPQFSSDAPVLYSHRDARFLVRELRRVGYNAFSRPWLFFAFKQWIAARKARPWK